MKLFEFMVTGGLPGMLIITILALVMIIFAIKKGIAIYKKADKTKKYLDIILFFGSLALAFGIFYQIVGMFEVFNVVAEIGDIAPALIMSGFKVTLIAPFYGFIIFIISYTCWFTYKIKIQTIE